MSGKYKTALISESQMIECLSSLSEYRSLI